MYTDAVEELVHPEKSNELPSESKSSRSEAFNAQLEWIKDVIIEFRRLSDSGWLLVKSTRHKFSVDSLETLATLATNKPLSIDIIAAGLHLFRRLPGIWVGSPISFHHYLRRPLEEAAKHMAVFDGADTYPRQVHIFPLCHRNNGYSLLEVNIRDHYIHHYDPVWTERSREYVRVS